MSKKIAQVVVNLPVDGPFDYAVPASLAERVFPGARVKVSFNRRVIAGIVTGFKQRSAFKRLNTIIEVLDNAPALSARTLVLAERISKYYGCSLGEACFCCLPNALRKPRVCDDDFPDSPPVFEKGKIKLIEDAGFHKQWEIIFPEVQARLEKGRSVVILLPSEMFLENVKSMITGGFSVPVIEMHKKLTEKKEREAWLQARGAEPVIILGTLSAAFTSARDLGLFVIVDEHSSVYKQEQSPFYDVRTIACLRAEIDGCDVILTGSSFLAETHKKARQKKWEIVSCVYEQAPQVQVIDLNHYASRYSRFLSFPLQNTLYRCLEEKKKVLLFMNLKGFGRVTKCNQCGFIVKCPRCDLNMTYMYSKNKLVCRHCNQVKDLPSVCPQCKGAYMRSLGGGIEKLQSEIARAYPQAKVASFDVNTKSLNKDADILVSTQSILNFKNSLSFAVTGVIDFDAQLNLFDFRSGNRAFCLLTDLYSMTREKFMIQSRMTDHYALKSIQKLKPEKFYREELKFRKEAFLPPFSSMLDVILRGKDDAFVFGKAHELFDLLKEFSDDTFDISDPHPDFLPKLRDKYRYVINVKSKSSAANLRLVKQTLKAFKRKKDVVLTVNVES